MRLIWKTIAGAVVAAALGVVMTLGHPAAEAQEFNQIKLTEKHIQGFIASQKELSAMADRLQASGDKPDPKLEAELEALAKKHGFASFQELDDVAANISMVMAGLDPQSGNYSDPIETIKKEMEDIKADKSIPEKDKKQMLDEMTQALSTTPPLKYKENIEVVKKHQAAIEKALQ
jgi:hypothetical protein